MAAIEAKTKKKILEQAKQMQAQLEEHNRRAMKEKTQQALATPSNKKTFATGFLSPAATPKSSAKKELPVVKDDHIKVKEPKESKLEVPAAAEEKKDEKKKPAATPRKKMIKMMGLF